MGLPAGAIPLSDEELQKALPKGAQSAKSPLAEEPWYARFARSTLKSAGLPESISDVPSWATRTGPGPSLTDTALTAASMGMYPGLRSTFDALTTKDPAEAYGKVAGPAMMAGMGTQAPDAVSAVRGRSLSVPSMPDIPPADPTLTDLTRTAVRDRTAAWIPQQMPRKLAVQPSPFAGMASSAGPPMRGASGPSLAGTPEVPGVTPPTPTAAPESGTLPLRPGEEPLVRTPEEFRAQDQLQRIAEQRASERGMQYAAGARTAGPNRPANRLFPQSQRMLSVSPQPESATLSQPSGDIPHGTPTPFQGLPPMEGESEMEWLRRNPPRGTTMDEDIQAAEAQTKADEEARRQAWERRLRAGRP